MFEGNSRGTSGRGLSDSGMDLSTKYELNYVTQDEAAAICGKATDTIRRYRSDGRLPNSRSRPDGTPEVAVIDLVAMNLLNPLLAKADVIGIASTSRAESDLVAAGRCERRA